MRYYELILSEAVGLKGARMGEIYTDPNGVEYTFQKWHWQFPADKDTYDSQEEIEQDILKQTDNDKEKIMWVNQWNPRNKSFAYAEFKNDDNQTLLIGKFFLRKNPNNTISDTEANQASGLRAGTKDKKASHVVKAESNLKPLQVGIADERARSVPSIIKAVSTHSQGNMLVDALNSAVNGEEIVYTAGASLAPALQDDFGEVLSPVAMISGHSKVQGTFQQAVTDVFKGADLRGALIKYPVSLINGLVDSYIIKDGMELAVSSKGKQGAKGSINNIYDAKQDSLQTSTGRAYVKKFPEAVEILDICKKESSKAAITLGLRYNLINSAEASALSALMEKPRDPARQLLGDPSNPEKTVKSIPEDLKKVPKELQRIFNIGGYKNGSYVGFICLARVARMVADHVNADPKIDFGEAIRSFLNSSAMVQVKTVVKTNGDDAVVSQINVIYPPNFTEKARMESNWMSGRQIKGGFSFSMPRS